MLGVFSPLFQTFTRAKAVRVERSTFCSLFLHDVVMRIQFSFLLKSEPISWWCQFRNWDTLYFFVTSLYDHFIRCWAMLHTSGLVTVKNNFRKLIFQYCFSSQNWEQSELRNFNPILLGQSIFTPCCRVKIDFLPLVIGSKSHFYPIVTDT